MSPAPVVVVGASLAGAHTVTALRSAGHEGPVVLLGAEPELPYERPELSKGYLAGTTARDRLDVVAPSTWADLGVEVRCGVTAVGLDADRRRVRLLGGEQVPYAALVVATGAANVRPPLPGIDLDGVHQLRTVADGERLRADVARAEAVVVVGTGFIGCEVAATLRGLGRAVTAVDAQPGPLWALGPELSAVVAAWHRARGVRLRLGQGVDRLVPDAGGRVQAVVLRDGTRLAADLVVVGVGVRPATGWLRGSRLVLEAGAVPVDADGRTALPDVYAAGDVAAVQDPVRGGWRRHEHWANAVEQGRRVGTVLAGAAPGPLPVPTAWSDQYDHVLQLAGELDPDCRLVVRGDLDRPEQPLLAFALDGGTVRAVVGVDAGRQFRRATRLIGRPVRSQDLVDPAVPPDELAAAG